MKSSSPKKKGSRAQARPAGTIPAEVIASQPWNGVMRAVWYVAVIPSILVCGYKIMAGGDLWWHLATGRWIWEHKSLPLVDSWSFTRAGQPWLQHEWLSDVVFQLVRLAFGVNALVYLKWLLLLATFLLLFKVLWRLTNEPVSAYAGTLLAVTTASSFLDIRPQLFSALGYVVLLVLTLPPRRPSYFLPLLFLVWVNLHAGFFFGLMALPILLSPAIFLGPASDRKRALLVIFGSALACLINPNGLETFGYPLKYAFDRSSPFKTLGEWLPPFLPEGIHSPVYPYAIGLFLCASAFLIFRRSSPKEQTKWPGLALGFLTLAMSLTSRRFVLLFAISQSLVTAPALARLAASWIQRIPRLIPPAIVALAGVIFLWPHPFAPYAFEYLTAEDEFPIETCNFIEANQLSGNVFCYYPWGGYLHMRTNGRMKVFIDGRADTVYDSETLLRYATVQAFRPGWEEIVEKSAAQFVLWPRNERGKPFAGLIASGRWQLLYDDFVSVLLVRSNQAPPPPLTPTPDSAYKRLTVGVQNFDQHKYDVAERAFEAALELKPSLRVAFPWLAHVQKLQGKPEEAARTWKRAERYFPLSQQVTGATDTTAAR